MKILSDQIQKYQDDLMNVETKEHVENVSIMTVFVARKFGYTDTELYELKEIARFHDIGKVKIPVEVLERNGPLTDEEWKLVRKHPIMGRDIMRDFGFTDEETAIVYQHHEKPDGSGYPQGLYRKDIKFEALIVSVVDVMDALLSDRSYKQGWKPEKVKEFFEKNEEGFCPIVVECVLDNFEELLKLRKEK